MSFLDRAIGVFAPRAELNRLQARAAVRVLREQATRSYDAARDTRRGMGWTRGESANGVTGPSLAILRSRARDLVRNTPMARVPDVLTAHIVGTGIVPVSRTGDVALDKSVNALFEAWQQDCLIGGEVDFYGLQALLCRSIIEGGEAFVRFLPRDSKSPLPVPLQIRAMEPDQIDESKHGVSTRSNAYSATLGVEFDEDGARKGYWVRKAAPHDPHHFRGLESVFVDARDIAHLYRPLRIGQVRGVTWFAPVLLTARDLADYLETSLVKAKTEACFAGFVTSGDANMPANLAQAGKASEPKPKTGELELSPGMMTRLEPGETVSFANPSSSGSFEPYVKWASMSIAAGMCISYDQLTGDLEGANYSSLKAGKIEFRVLVRQFQHHIMVRMFCRPLWKRFIEAALLAGKLLPREGGYPASWIPPGFEPIDPLKDIKADIMAVRTGRMTWDEYVAEWGNDPQMQLDELERINAEFDKRGLILDTDPRKVGAGGSAQPNAQNQDEGTNDNV